MTLTLDLPTPIAQQFRQEADSEGLSLNNYLVQLLKQVAQLPPKQAYPKQFTEAELLKNINLGITEAEWIRYKHLIGLRRAERLTEQEHEALIGLGDKIEQANAQRLKYLLALAQLRGVSLEKLITSLGIQPVEV